MPKYIYKIKGLHCPSCELVIEDRLKEEKSIQSADVNLKKQEIVIESASIISPNKLNQIFKKDHYVFSEITAEEENTIVLTNENLWWLWSIFIIGIFLALVHLGLASFLNINNNSSLLAFFVFGLIAGFSSCGALLSGIILSQPKNTWKILLGRVVSYSILGGILGMIGQKVAFSPVFADILLILVSLVMIVVALQMLGLKMARQFNFFLPKTASKKIIEHRFPIVLGFLTVLLPCGFTLLTEGVAILSGNWTKGLLVMLFFVLGTSIPLFLIGFSSDKLLKNQKIVGVLILFFVLYNLNFNFGITQKIFISNKDDQNAAAGITPSFVNAQVIIATYSAGNDISPNSFTIKKGQPVRFVINVNDNGSGCMSTIMIQGLYQKPQSLIKGQTIVMEFVPQEAGTYQITCAMGVPRGTINVVD